MYKRYITILYIIIVVLCSDNNNNIQLHTKIEVEGGVTSFFSFAVDFERGATVQNHFFVKAFTPTMRTAIILGQFSWIESHFEDEDINLGPSRIFRIFEKKKKLFSTKYRFFNTIFFFFFQRKKFGKAKSWNEISFIKIG